MNVAVIGAQWGDEGKGKIVDLLSERFDVVARFQGGPNAGHTVIIGENRYALHHVPSGVFRSNVRAVIGNGTVLDPARLLEEIDGLQASGIELDGRLFISDRAAVILPVMNLLDAHMEQAAGGEAKIGTTLRGIGPTYQSKAARIGIRMCDIFDVDHLERSIVRLLEAPPFRALLDAGVDVDARSMAEEVHACGKRLAPFVTDTSLVLNDWNDEGLQILFEGAQGTLLDLDHGSYPFVTSSTTVTGGLCGGLGVAPTRLDGSLGVFKAYGTRVGAGPMPTELEDGEDGFGAKLRRRGNEFGTTTGRPRRCGWFDGVAAAYANRINRFDAACITLLDVLDAFDEIRVCTGYRLGDRVLRSFPASTVDAERVEPVYEAHAGWNQDLTAVRRWADLPAAAVAYLDRLSEIIGTEIGMVGVGPDRAQSIVRPGSWIDRELGLGRDG